MSVSYADAASTKIAAKSEETAEQPIMAASIIQDTTSSFTEQKDGEAKESESPLKSGKTLAPAPVPIKSVWGSTITKLITPMVDELKFPSPDLIPPNSQTTTKSNAKFGKSNKWIPITAKVVFSSPRNTPTSSGNGSSHRGKRKSRVPRKKSNSAGSNGEPILKKDENTTANKLDLEIETALVHTSSDLETQLSNTEVQTQASSAFGVDTKQRPQNSSIYNQQKGYKKYQNGTYNGRASGPQQSQMPMHRQQGNGYYQPMIPQQYQGNSKNYRSMSNPYGRTGSNGNIAMGGFIPGSNLRSMPGSMHYIPHHPQPLIGAIPYGPPMPIQIPPPLSPKQNPQQALTQQIDYYFSLENLIRDLFLRKNMGTEGWVDLDLILNFKRVEIIINGLRNSIEVADEKIKEEKLDKAIVKAVQQCENLEIGYLNGKEDYNAAATEMQLRVKYNFEQWLLPDNL